MKKLKYEVEIELSEDIYAELEALAKLSNKDITVSEAFKQLLEEGLEEGTVGLDDYRPTVTYIEQEEQ